ncbi:hypothetical protein A0H81_14561 [Grifola frondosa]|uniref:Uncharacterized protein n=1 Tax=Grifola frondosa TaxID=5627 RepID=A0A1C7LLG9_GRIFR|nr:hypothetical protein A0H81_14561 [Grifola frondosa]
MYRASLSNNLVSSSTSDAPATTCGRHSTALRPHYRLFAAHSRFQSAVLPSHIRILPSHNKYCAPGSTQRRSPIRQFDVARRREKLGRPPTAIGARYGNESPDRLRAGCPPLVTCRRGLSHFTVATST